MGGASVRRRAKHDKILQSVEILQSLDAYERSQISDALKEISFSKGDFVVKQGDPGDNFYIVEEGSLHAEKNEQRVMEYKEGDYFGELALLRGERRAASVIVNSEKARVLFLGQNTFQKMLGPLQAKLEK